MSNFKWTGQGPSENGGQSVEVLDDWQDQNGANGVPGPGDSATIDIDAQVSGVLDAESLEIDANVGYNGSLFTLGGDLLINTPNGFLTLSDDTDGTVGGDLQVAQDAFDDTDGQTYESTLQIDQGSTLTVDDDALVGDAAGASGYIDVMQGASLAVDGTLDIGGAGLGVVYVLGTLSVGSLALGGDATAYQSLLELGGPTASFTDATPLVVGYDATFGEFRLAYGASFSTPYDLVVGLDDTGQAFASGAVEVDESTLTVGGNLLLGEADGTGQVEIDYFNTDDAGASLAQVAGNVIVGDAADASGAINIGNQGTLSILAGHSLDLGAVLDSTGNLDLNAAGAVLSMTGTLVIGDAGTGEVGVENGARLSVTGEQALAVQSTARAEVYVAALGEFTVLGELDVGQGGTGTLEAASGGTITASSADIGELAGSDGTVIVTGADPTTSDPSTWTVANALTVGDAGAGSLAIEAGGKVTSASGLIGTGAANDGTVTVDGSGSSWAITNSLTLGVQGGTGAPSLTISDDASVTTTADPGDLNYMPDGTITLETGGTLTDADLDMHDAATLVVESGALLTDTGGDGDSQGLCANGTVTLNDATLMSPDAETDIGDETTFGGAGTGTLTAENGATATNLVTVLGYFSGDSGALILTGDGTTWTDIGATAVDANDAGMNVGDSGTGALTIEAGAVLSEPNAYIKIGQFEGASGTALVTGAGSEMNAGGLLRVGDSGQGTLTVADSALAAVGAVQVGVYSTSSGLLTITSGGTLTTNSASTVDVGAAGGGAEPVTAGNFTIGVLSGAKGTVSVDGGTLTVEGELVVGDGGSGSLAISDAGVVTSASGEVGTGTGDSGTVTVDGSGSSWAITNSLTLGVQGGTGASSLTISDDASVTTTTNPLSGDDLYSGSLTLESGGQLSETGLDMHDAATLTIESGATLAEVASSTAGAVYYGLGANGTVTIDAGTLASAGEYIQVGVITQTGGAGNGTLTASDGATVIGLATDLGEFAGDSGTVTLTGTDTTWTDTFDTPVDSNDAGFNVGARGNGSLLIEDGATLSNPLAYIKIGQFAGATGTATVTGAGSTMSAGGLLRVGDSGQGTLTVADSALAAVGAVQVGVYSTSSGLLTITSGGTLTTNSASTVDVGAAGGGAEPVTAGNLTIGVLSGAKGTVSVDGGTLTVEGELVVGDGGSGTLDVADSTVTAGFLNVGALGSVTLSSGGTIDTGGVHVSSGGDINLAGGKVDPPAPITIDAGGEIDGYGSLVGDIDNNGLLLVQGGTADIAGTVSGNGMLEIQSGGTLFLDGTVAAGQVISFSGSGALQLGPDAEIDAALNEVAVGDVLELPGTVVDSVIFDPESLSVTTSAGVFDFSNVTYQGATPTGYTAVADPATGLEAITFTGVACFLAGTRFRTPGADVAVEDLAIGDTVTTAHGDAAARRIKWIGRRSYSPRFIAGNRDILPIVIRAGALADGVPARDLAVSPKHAMLLDNVLIPAELLVNGHSVVQLTQIDAITYLHIELDSHDVIFAEGAASETFVDCDSRGMFHNAAEFYARYPGDAAPRWQFCAPRVESGLQLEAIRSRLNVRAGIGAGEAPAARQAGELRGWIDAASGEVISGWAWQAEHPDTPARLEILADDGLIGQVVANESRHDVRDAGHGDGRSGFTLRLEHPLSPFMRHVIRVRRVADGAELRNSGAVTIPAVAGLDAAALAGFAATLRATAANAGSQAEQDALVRFMAAETERLLTACARRGAAMRRDPRPLALFIDETLPARNRDGGSNAALDHIRSLQQLGYRVVLATREMAAAGPELAALDVTFCLPPVASSVEEVLRRIGGDAAVVYLHRISTAALYLPLVRHYCPQARVIYSVADLHGVRMARRAALEGNAVLAAEGRRFREQEFAAAQAADSVITHSTHDAALLRRHAPGANVHVVPWSVAARPRAAPFGERRGIAFIGSYRHAPNVDAAQWLAREIMPRVWQQDPAIECLLVGSDMPDALRRIGRQGMTPLGHVADLQTVFDRVRLTAAPLRYGAGLKGKVLDSLAAGVPCVCTPVAAEGLAWPPLLQGCVGADAAELAALILRLHADEQHNDACAAAGLHLARNDFSAERIDRLMRRAIGDDRGAMARQAAEAGAAWAVA